MEVAIRGTAAIRVRGRTVRVALFDLLLGVGQAPGVHVAHGHDLYVGHAQELRQVVELRLASDADHAHGDPRAGGRCAVAP